MHDNFSPIEDLMKINNKTADKQSVFEEYRQKYLKHFSSNDEFEAKRQQLAQTIQQCMGPFTALLSQQAQDPARMMFFQQLNEAIIAQSNLQNMLEQCSQFYTQLNDRLVKLQQSIQDYKFGRDMQKNDILVNASKAPAAKPQPTTGVPPMAQPNAYG